MPCAERLTFTRKIRYCDYSRLKRAFPLHNVLCTTERAVKSRSLEGKIWSGVKESLLLGVASLQYAEDEGCRRRASQERELEVCQGELIFVYLVIERLLGPWKLRSSSCAIRIRLCRVSEWGPEVPRSPFRRCVEVQGWGRTSIYAVMGGNRVGVDKVHRV